MPVRHEGNAYRILVLPLYRAAMRLRGRQQAAGEPAYLAITPLSQGPGRCPAREAQSVSEGSSPKRSR